MPMQQCSTINNYLMKIHMHLVATQAISPLVMKQYQAHYTLQCQSSNAAQYIII
jgi:hypothetical protein